MAQINKGDTFADGQQVSASRLNQLLDSATLLAGCVTEQAAITVNTLAAEDLFLAVQVSTGQLIKAKLSDIWNSNTGQINLPNSLVIGSSSNNTFGLTVGQGGGTQASFLTLNGPFSASSSTDLSNTVSFGLYQTGAGTANFLCNYTGLFQIPYAVVQLGWKTTAQDLTTVNNFVLPSGPSSARPSTPVIGSTRVNTDLQILEIWDGTIWRNGYFVPKIYIKAGTAVGATTGGGTENLIYQTPVLPTIPSDETWTYEITIKTSSGYTTGSTRPDGTVPYLNVYKGTSLITKIQAATNDWGSFNATYTYAFVAASGDTWSFKHVSSGALVTDPTYVVKLTKVQTASLADKDTCI